uniref:Secreted protein n=1 Tax=Anabas testudineus TaxID=64144 RepID=A0A7N6F6B6_ANATE
MFVVLLLRLLAVLTSCSPQNAAQKGKQRWRRTLEAIPPGCIKLNTVFLPSVNWSLCLYCMFSYFNPSTCPVCGRE